MRLRPGDAWLWSSRGRIFWTTVFDNVAIGLRMRHVPKKEVQVRVDEALALRDWAFGQSDTDVPSPG